MRYFSITLRLNEISLRVLKAVVKCGQNKNKTPIVYGKKQNLPC